MTVCPQCLRDEFAPARPVHEQKASKSIKQVNELSRRRAEARAERLSDGIQTGSAFGPHGTLRFVTGVVVFLICSSIFLFCSKLEPWQVESFLPESAQRPLSIIFCWVAAILVFRSRCNKWLVYPVVIFFLVAGWFTPDIWFGLAAREKRETAAAIASSRADRVDETLDSPDASARKNAGNGRELTEEDLAIFREKRQAEGDVVNYGIYINTRDVGLRQSIRDTLARLLVAESCVPYTRGQGSLFIVSRSAGGKRNIGRVVARFGDLNYANPSEGIYEVDFSADKVCAVSHFPSDVLASPTHESFVAANLAELRNLLDPHRIATAANALAAANVKSLRGDVRAALKDVLRDPWTSEPETYKALIEALVIYAEPGDKVAVDMCRKYFLYGRSTRRTPSAPVMDLLIREVPGEMVAPVVELWCSNPVEWGSTLSLLGTRPQPLLLDVLSRTDSLQLIGSILKHLENNGTPEAIPAVKQYTSHSDSLISRSARNTLRALEAQ